jgi:DNA-binding response OmpR family regulator
MNILLVEDKVGAPIVKLLEKWGYQVFLAEDGEQAWKILERVPMDFFLIDWMLPGLSGLELVEKIRGLDQCRDTPIVMISGRSQKEDIVRAAHSGIDSYMAKPFSGDQLRDKIESVLRKRQEQGSPAARVQRLLRGQAGFDPRADAPLILLGAGARTQEELAALEPWVLGGLEAAGLAVAAANAAHPGLDLGYVLVESTAEMAQLLNKWSIRERTRMAVLWTLCKGNPSLLVRLLGAKDLQAISSFLVRRESAELSAELQAACAEGRIALLESSRLNEAEWGSLIEVHVVSPWQEQGAFSTGQKKSGRPSRPGKLTQEEEDFLEDLGKSLKRNG